MMHKRCECGEMMDLRLRTVIYSSKVEIENVPIFCCNSCNRSEVFPTVKTQLTKLISQLGSEPEKQLLLFHDLNELSHLMYRASDKQHVDVPMEMMIEERINQLLDLLLLAQSLDDRLWVEDVRLRLSQITNMVIFTYDS